jgi:adenosylcobinamide-GDP ribazoletransferase
LGRDIKDNARWIEAGLATVTALAAAILLARWQGVAALGLGLLLALALALFTLRRIPGLTGDSYGAICEMVETGVLVFFTLEGIG